MLHKAVEMSKWKPLYNIIYERENISKASLNAKTDLDWNVVRNMDKPFLSCVPVEANDPLYILYTSGSTKKPKGVQRPTGGHLAVLVYTMKTIFTIKS